MAEQQLIAAIRAELLRHVDPKYKDGAQNYFKEGIVLHGVRTPRVRAISAEYYHEVKGRSKAGIFSLCDRLLSYGTCEERAIAFDWAYRLRKQYEPSDFKIFQRWLRDHVDNWGGVDDLCCHTFGAFIDRFPEYLPSVFKWTTAKPWHMRRAAAVILIYPVRQGKYFANVLRTSDALLRDEHYLVQKGYGWLLKEATKEFPRQVLAYVLEHKADMPRTALRYAIEKMPEAWKQRAMAK
ncbi:MAG: DNA alkylation repair protein [Candidatus Edwardsbacteria bacterium]|jgi:3-methyladenine DNA glycosylase AlkD|nr:DNA alkylation repair protein [Candidatus Edwardsbacteria bacterium]